jgi:peptidoglycan/xylan/chitin deacetylase (PgdA/CDA1 family)
MSLPQRLNNFVTRHLPMKLIPSRLERPVASLTFDDFPKSAWTRGRSILARYDARATYYVAGRFCGQFEDGLKYYDADDLAEIQSAGHEIGCHTFSHQHGTGVASAELESDATRNQAFVTETLGDYRLSSFAYPYGDVSPRTKLLFGRRFPSSRGIGWGVNAGVIDLAQLKAIGLEHPTWRPAAIEQAVEKAAARNGWIIFFTHDVSDTPGRVGATPEMLDHALSCVRARGIDILPVKSALAQAAFRLGSVG